MEIFVDPFGRGEILLEEGCQRKLTQLHGKDFQFDRSCLDTVNPRQILTRMLHNLKGIYWNQQNYTKALGVIEKVLLINPSAPAELRDRGFAHYQLNHLSSAIKDWSRYLELRPGAPDAAEVARSLKVAAQSVRIQKLGCLPKRRWSFVTNHLILNAQSDQSHQSGAAVSFGRPRATRRLSV